MNLVTVEERLLRS